jgi:mono/diheme cytochrome c family protein
MRRIAAPVLLVLAACGGGEEAETEMEAGAEAPAAGAPATTPPADAPAAGAAAGGTAALPAGVTQEMVTAGQTMFAGSVCAACHGPQATGVQGIGPNLTDQEWLNVDGSYESIVQVINTGVPQPKQAPTPMAPKGGNAALTDEQVRQLAAYIYSRSHS